MYSFRPPSANIHSILADDVPRTELVGLPTKVWFNVGPALQPIAGSMPVNHLRRWPTLIYHRVCCILCANTGHSTNVDQCWPIVFDAGPSLKPSLGDCTVFSALCWWGFDIQAPEKPDNTIHSPNADVMLCHRLRRWANIIPTKTLKLLTTNIIVTRQRCRPLDTPAVKKLKLTWTSVKKCQPFPTHSTLHSPE